MVAGVGGLAAGLAQGLQTGIQLRNQTRSLDLQKQYQDRLAKADERDAEIHELRKDQYASEKEIRDRRNRALQKIADYTANITGAGSPAVDTAAPAATTPGIQDPNAPGMTAPAPQQTPSSIQLAGPIPQGGLAMNAPAPFAANNPAGALAHAPQPAQPEAIKPAKVLERGMVTGMYTPKMLTDIANIFASEGLHDEGVKYMNQAYTAQQRGAVQVATAFMQNNPEAAAQALQNGGVELEGMPVKVKPDDPNDQNWKLNIKGQGERTINVRDWLRSTMDPEEFFKAEDRRLKDERDAAMDKRKQDYVEQKGRAELGLDAEKTRAQIGYLKSRSDLAAANADKADRWEPGSLRPSRSSESQINSALSQREKRFNRAPSALVKNEDTGKFEVDPTKRLELDSQSNRYQTFLEEQRGEELDARDHHKFTDVMMTYPVGGTPEQIEEWQRKEFLPRFGIKRKTQNPPETRTETPNQGKTAQAPARGLATEAPKPTGPKPGSLAWMKEQADRRATINREMEGVQQALQTPNLSAEQKKALALKAQEIAKRRDALK